MGIVMVILTLVLLGCQPVVKTCDEQPHQLKCPGHEGHGH